MWRLEANSHEANRRIPVIRCRAAVTVALADQTWSSSATERRQIHASSAAHVGLPQKDTTRVTRGTQTGLRSNRIDSETLFAAIHPMYCPVTVRSVRNERGQLKLHSHYYLLLLPHSYPTPLPPYSLLSLLSHSDFLPTQKAILQPCCQRSCLW